MTKPPPSRPRAANDTPSSSEAEARPVPLGEPPSGTPHDLAFKDGRDPPKLASGACPAADHVSPEKLAETLSTPCRHKDGTECKFRTLCESIAAKRREQ